MRISDWSSDVCSSDLLRLPDTHDANPVLRNARGVDQTIADCERTDRGREIAAVSGPVDEGLVDRHLPETIVDVVIGFRALRSEEHTSELQSLMRISYAVFCLKKKKQNQNKQRM